MIHEPSDDAPTGELIKQAIEDARELVRIEVGLVKAEAKSELKAASHAAIAAGVALVALFFCLSTAVLALVLALGAKVAIALVVAGIFLFVACVAALAAWRLLPVKAFDDTRRRIEGEIRELKEHMA
jgi:hypothetical protein